MNIALFHVNESDVNLNKQLSWPSEGYNLTGTFKNDTDILNPIIVIESTSIATTFEKLLQYNYCYLYNFNRYYFIDNIRFALGNLIELVLKPDPLFTFKNMILSQNAHILKNEFTYNKDIDEHLNVRADLDINIYTDTVADVIDITRSREFHFDYTNEYHCIINCLATPSTGLGSPTTVPAYNNLPAINYEMASDMFLGGIVQCLHFSDLAVVMNEITNNYSSLMTFVKNIALLPFQPTRLADLGNKVYIGNLRVIDLPSNKHCYTLTYGSRERILFRTFQVSRHYNDFRDYEPYTKYNFYLPFVGWINLKAVDILDCRCRVYYSYDYETSKGLCYIYNVTKGIVIYTTECSMAVKVSLSQTNIEQNNIAAEQHAIQFGMKTLTSLFAAGAFSVVTGNPVPLAAGIVGGGLAGIGEVAHQMDAYIDTASSQPGTYNLITQLPLDMFVKIIRSNTVVDPENANYKHIYGRSCNNEFGQLSQYNGFTKAFIDDFVYPNITDQQNDRTPTKAELDIILQKLKDGVYLP